MFLKVKLNSSQAASLLRENREKAKVKRCEDYFTWRYLKALCMDVIFNFKGNFNLGQGWWNNEATTYLYGSWDFSENGLHQKNDKSFMDYFKINKII